MAIYQPNGTTQNLPLNHHPGDAGTRGRQVGYHLIRTAWFGVF